jgi:hypothetical protein
MTISVLTTRHVPRWALTIWTYYAKWNACYVSLKNKGAILDETCCPQGAGSRYLRNSGTFLSKYTASHPRRLIFKALGFSYLLSIKCPGIMCLKYVSGIWQSGCKYNNRCAGYATTWTCSFTVMTLMLIYLYNEMERIVSCYLLWEISWRMLFIICVHQYYCTPKKGLYRKAKSKKIWCSIPLHLPRKLHMLVQATQPAEPDRGAVGWQWAPQCSLLMTHPPWGDPSSPCHAVWDGYW